MFSSIACLRFLNVQMLDRAAKRSWKSTKYIKISPQGKKLKLEGDDVTRSSSSLSPEQLERINKSRKAALERLSEHKSAPDGIGESWKKALSAEFEKNYFKSVSKT